MKHIVFALAALAGMLGSAQATVLDFDDLAQPGGLSQLGIIEQNFQFSDNTRALDVSSTGGWWSSGANGGHSGKYAALNDVGGDMVMTRFGGGTFSVQDLWLNGWQGAQRTSTIEGWLGGVQVKSLTVSYGSPWQDVALDFDGIDQLVITGNGFFLVDDIRVKVPMADPGPGGSVPEPAAPALFGAAIGALALVRRRRRD